MTFRIANGAGFLGDQLAAPGQLVEAETLDVLTLEYLAELTMSILARQRDKHPSRGYAADFLEVLPTLLPALTRQPQLHVVTNAGGVNPRACAAAAAQVLVEAGLGTLPVGVVEGDDLLPRLGELQSAGCDFAHQDTGQALAQLPHRIVAAHAYLGAAAITAALGRAARLVITGRVADASLTLGPCVHRFGWNWDDWDRLAGASVAGHLIECGAQVSGGYSSRWQQLELASVGYPVAEITSSGEALLRKPQGSGGKVDRLSVVQQLVYEIGDPARYLTPDVVVDFTPVTVEETGRDEVAVRGARGYPAPSDYKVSLAYEAGYRASGWLVVYGPDAGDKALACAAIIRDRLRQAGIELAGFHVERFGMGDAVPRCGDPAPRPFDSAVSPSPVPERLAGPASEPPAPGGVGEVVLRITAQDPRRAAVERFTRELAPLITSGPAGLAGYAAGRPAVQAVYAYWPTRIPRRLVAAHCDVRSAAAWLREVPA